MSGDLLSDALDSLRLCGAEFHDVRAASPWVLRMPPGDRIAPRMGPGAQHSLACHVVTHGRCWLALCDDGASIPLPAGSAVLLSHGDAHTITSAAGSKPRAHAASFGPRESEEALPFRLDQRPGKPASARLLCALLACDTPVAPLLHSLPPLIQVREGHRAGATLGALVAAARCESGAPRPGATAVRMRLGELLLMDILRRYAAASPTADPAWLAVRTDPCVGRALRLLHDDPARAWTLRMLARSAGVSRTVLVERFTGQIGTPPMHYLHERRMAIASRLLAEGTEPITRVASHVGYGSEEAFGRAFKRATGRTPGAWRRQTAGH